MLDAINLIFDFIADIFLVLEECRFDFGSYSVSLLHLFLAFLVIGMFASIWWRGAKG